MEPFIVQAYAREFRRVRELRPEELEKVEGGGDLITICDASGCDDGGPPVRCDD